MMTSLSPSSPTLLPSSTPPPDSSTPPLPAASLSPALSSSTKAVPSNLTNLLDLSRTEMEAFFATLGEKPYRARQIFRWIYKQSVFSFDTMTDISLALRQRLQDITEIRLLEVDRVMDSVDGTRKILFRLQDGAKIEAVLIPIGRRLTLCISSQVGCAIGCRFCYTATMGPGRNLSVAEFMGQFLGASLLAPEGQDITNVVFMGMGEPLVNFKNLLRTISILTDELGPKLGNRRVTVSTAGLCPQILELGRAYPVRLAVSLHATTDEQRDSIMPINKRYNLQTLFDTLREFQSLPSQQRLPVTLEYTLIKAVNDSEQDAKRLVKLSRSLRTKINLIPYNEHPGAPFKRPSPEEIYAFLRKLQEASVLATERTTRGDDILAACGQLAIESDQSHAPTETYTKGDPS